METPRVNVNELNFTENSNDKINIKLVKNVLLEGEPGLSESPHKTAVTGKPVESYTLKVTYAPDYSVCPVGRGGPGTTWMYILGMLLTVVAGGALVVRRRMRSA